MGIYIGGVNTVEPPGFPVLRQMLDRYADEAVTDEQVARVLAPVLAMIRAGRFDRPRGGRYSWLIRPMILVIAVVALIITMAAIQPAGIYM
ncbi:MAG: hypothetical protein LBJ91_00270 [Clostridiales Family XIII bacterium]|jgi:hypothetical protein|nr:hypothetical protein [Clostridiales Family XIII bacterium]